MYRDPDTALEYYATQDDLRIYAREHILYDPGRHEYHDAGGLNLSKSDFEKLIENSDGFDIM